MAMKEIKKTIEGQSEFFASVPHKFIFPRILMYNLLKHLDEMINKFVFYLSSSSHIFKINLIAIIFFFKHFYLRFQNEESLKIM